jgi:hypothetical protein
MNTALNQNRSLNFFIASGLVLAFVAVALTVIITSAKVTDNVVPDVPQNIAENTNDVAFAPLSAGAFPQYHQSEWHSSAVPVTSVSGLEMYRQSERTLIPAQAGLMAYQLSERTLVNPLGEYLASERTLSPIVNVDLSSYHLSERTMTEAVLVNNFAEYFASERTLVDPQAGLATYFESERTSVPVQFTQYQISEWLGK